MTTTRVLVTGACGFLGRHVARRCDRQGWVVTGIGHGTWGRQEWRAFGLSEWRSCDITLNSLLTYGGEPDLIFHCAGSGSVNFSQTHPRQDYQRTVTTSVDILEFARVHAPQTKLVYPSSAAVYGASGLPTLSETAPTRPVSIYGVHKRVVEELFANYIGLYGLSGAIVRLFSVYGCGLRKQLFWEACHKIGRRDFAFSGSGLECRDWLHVEDAAALMIVAAEHAAPSCPVVNGGTGDGVSVRVVLSHLFQCFGLTESPRFLGVARSGDPQHLVADVERVSRWDWKPLKDWRSGVRDYVGWFRKDGGCMP